MGGHDALVTAIQRIEKRKKEGNQKEKGNRRKGNRKGDTLQYYTTNLAKKCS